MLRIHSTFLEKLFLAPSFQEDDSDVGTMYLKLKNRMFPGEEDYVAFLQAQSSEDQFSRAENIVHRLCYESNFPPTYYSIKDLISIEEDQARKYSGFDGYVPRDHFIHIVKTICTKYIITTMRKERQYSIMLFLINICRQV